MSEPSMLILETARRGRGRPKATIEKTSVTAWIPVKTYDRLTQIANRRDISLSALIDQVITKQISHKKHS